MYIYYKCAIINLDKQKAALAAGKVRLKILESTSEAVSDACYAHLAIKQDLQHLSSVVGKNHHNELVIVVAGFDADAFASAVAFAKIVKGYHPYAAVKILICGCFGHPQNKAIHDRFAVVAEVPVVFYAGNFDKEIARHDVVLVDSSKGTDSRVSDRAMAPVIIIDHHLADTETKSSGYSWCDNSVGAASTLLAELWQEAYENIVPELASLIALGIYMDTGKLVHASSRDMTAYAWMLERADKAAIESILNADHPSMHTAYLAAADRSADRRNPVIVAGLDTVDPDHAACIATVADHMVDRQGITLAIVWGVVGDMVRISVRTKNHSMPIDELVKQLFGECGGAKVCGAKDRFGIGGACIKLSTVPDCDLHRWFSRLVYGS